MLWTKPLWGKSFLSSLFVTSYTPPVVPVPKALTNKRDLSWGQSDGGPARRGWGAAVQPGAAVAWGGPGSSTLCLQRSHGGDGAGLFTVVQSERARDGGHKLKQEVQQWISGELFLCEDSQVVSQATWDVQSSTLGVWPSWMRPCADLRANLLWGGGWTRDPLRFLPVAMILWACECPALAGACYLCSWGVPCGVKHSRCGPGLDIGFWKALLTPAQCQCAFVFHWQVTKYSLFAPSTKQQQKLLTPYSLDCFSVLFFFCTADFSFSTY